MTNNTTKLDSLQPAAEMAVDLFDNWFDPIETELRARAREFIEELIRGELDTMLARPRYGRSQMAGNEGRAPALRPPPRQPDAADRARSPIEIAVPRARLNPPRARRRNGRAKRCEPISAARWPPTR